MIDMYFYCMFVVRDIFCSYGVMELCTRGLGILIVTLKVN